MSLSYTMKCPKPTSRPHPKLEPPASISDIRPSHGNEQVQTAILMELVFGLYRSGYFCDTPFSMETATCDSFQVKISPSKAP